jgi:hypothetical protein
MFIIRSESDRVSRIMKSRGMKRQLISGSQASCLNRDWIVIGAGSSWIGQNNLSCDWCKVLGPVKGRF